MKHGVSFDEGAHIFDDPFALRVNDEKHSTRVEKRMQQIGETTEGCVFVVVFTIRRSRAAEAYRIISARRASKKERALYEFNKRVPIS